MSISRFFSLFSLGLPLLISQGAAAADLHIPADFASLQAAVDAASDGDSLFVATGTYIEQVMVNDKALNFIGEDGAMLQGPAGFEGGILTVENGDIYWENIDISGANGAGAEKFYGILAKGSQVAVAEAGLSQLNSAACPDCQIGLGILAITHSDSGLPSTLVFENSSIDGYQKGGIVVYGQDSDGYILESTLTGTDMSALVAQNGVQFSAGATGAVENSMISGHLSQVGSVAVGVLAAEALSISVLNNELAGNQLSVYDYGSLYMEIERNKFVGGGGTPYEIGLLSASPAENAADASCMVHANAFSYLDSSLIADDTSAPIYIWGNLMVQSPYSINTDDAVVFGNLNFGPRLERHQALSGLASPYQP